MKRFLGGLLLCTILLSACQPELNGKEKKNVVVSIYPFEFLVSQIAKEEVQLATIVPAGAEPHDYELTPQDVGAVMGTDLLILDGALEPWVFNLQENLKALDTKILSFSSELTLLDAQKESPDAKDPHIWLDPDRMAQMADLIRDALILVDPPHATVYTSNTLTLKEKLKKLDTDYKNGLAHCGKTTFVTAHAAFAYLADRYGLTQVAIAGLSPSEEPSIQQLKELIDFTRDHQVDVVFFENLVSPELAETIANEVGAQTMVLNPIEGLTSAQKSGGENYLSLMEENLDHLKTALSCQ